MVSDLRLILHAGMGKAGSTAIQWWLGHQAADLAECGIVSLRWRRTPDAEGGWEVVASGSAASDPHAQHAEFASHESFLQRVSRHSGSPRTVVISGEHWYRRLHEGHKEVHAWLDAVAVRASLEIVIYVRPQHLWAEAGWRQWGFRKPMPASEWVSRASNALDYRWLTRLAERLGGSTLRLHPVVDGPSGRTDVVEHFATAILGLPLSHPSIRSAPQSPNVGLPLRVCAALWRDPPTGLWIDEHDNRRLDALKLMLDDGLRHSDESDSTSGEIRRVMYDWAVENFGAANEELLFEMGWDPEGWPVSSDSRGAGLDAIDRLLGRELAPAEAAALSSHVERLVALSDEQVTALMQELRKELR